MEVKLVNLTKEFEQRGKKKNDNTPNVVAVNHINVNIPSGKLIGLLGPSGCGKSTTLYMIAGLHTPTDGQIFFGEQDITTLAPEKRGIGLVFQNYALYPHTPGEGGAGTVSPLGEELNYVNIDGRYYTGSKGISNDLGKELFAQEIRLFADPDNYPIYIHCSLGRDRTGTLAFVIEALLGVNKNNLMMDYEISVFSYTGTQDNASVAAIRNNIRATYDYIATYDGANFAEKTENYLLSIGITAEEIQTIKDLLLEEVK